MKFQREYASTRRLGSALVAAFVLVVLCFLGSTVLASRYAGKISEAADSIVTNGAPAIQLVSAARSTARRLELALDDLVDAVQVHAPTADLEAAVRGAHEQLGAVWAAYRRLPPYPGEAELWDEVDSTRVRATLAMDEILTKLGQHDVAGASAVLNGTAKPTFDRLDELLHDAVDFDARQVERLGSEVTATRAETLRLVFISDVASACLAGVAATLLFLMLRHQARLFVIRASDLEHFAGRVAHDIRSPLACVSLALDTAKRGSVDAETARVALERGTRTIQRIGQLVDGLLVFARAGAAPEEGAQADVRSVVRGVVEDIHPVAEAKGVEITIDDIAASTVACGPGVLASIVSNLVGNAVKYMGEAPARRVSIRARDAGPRSRLEVEDTGPGVPAELRERVFDPYVRLASSTEHGLGLGLATVRQLAVAHGGAAGIGETKTKLGSLFWVELPTAAPAPLATQAPHPRYTLMHKLQSMARSSWRAVNGHGRLHFHR
jgi:signal transduction histidine kinase